jgi:hypothetical protein
MQRFWPGRRLHELLTGDMTWREFRTFVRRLPQESALARSELGEVADWRVAEHLLARIANITLQTGSAKSVPDSQLVTPPSPPRADKPEVVGGAKELDELFLRG